jgi:hypothetical protein
MTAPSWQLDGQHARLQLDRLAGAIDLSRPGDGLAALEFDGHRLGAAGILGVAIPCSPAGDPQSVVESYVRGTDLVASYRESQDWPIRVEARWRAGAPPTPGAPLAAFELAVSVQTAVLDCLPELSVRSALPAQSVWRLADGAAARFETLGRARPSCFGAQEGPACLLFRLNGSALSYVEMVHPADFLEDRLEDDGGSSATVTVCHRLFGGRLEKGVILRARVWGAFLPRDNDMPVAAECSAGFAAAELPLGA